MRNNKTNNTEETMRNKIYEKNRTISNIIDFCNNAPDGLMERDGLVRSLLKQLSHKKLKQLEKAYFENMDEDKQEFLKDQITYEEGKKQ
jgi:hypothetical protein